MQTIESVEKSDPTRKLATIGTDRTRRNEPLPQTHRPWPLPAEWDWKYGQASDSVEYLSHFEARRLCVNLTTLREFPPDFLFPAVTRPPTGQRPYRRDSGIKLKKLLIW